MDGEEATLDEELSPSNYQAIYAEERRKAEAEIHQIVDHRVKQRRYAAIGRREELKAAQRENRFAEKVAEHVVRLLSLRLGESAPAATSSPPDEAGTFRPEASAGCTPPP